MSNYGVRGKKVIQVPRPAQGVLGPEPAKPIGFRVELQTRFASTNSGYWLVVEPTPQSLDVPALFVELVGDEGQPLPVSEELQASFADYLAECTARHPSRFADANEARRTWSKSMMSAARGLERPWLRVTSARFLAAQ